MNHPRPETDQSQTVRKRRRTQLACNTCRDRKTRCNGERPACSSCTRRGVRDSCSYEEVTVGSHRSAVSPGYSASNGNTIATPGLVASDSPSPSTKDRPPSPTLHISNASPAGKVDALAMVADSTTGDSLYGRSSTIALVSQVREAASIPAAQRSPASGSQNSLEILHKQDFYNFILPQRQHADAFLACYWEFAHPVFPILHMPSFNSSYDQLWVSRTEADKHSDELDDTIFHATLNLVFALGCQYSSIVPPGKKSSSADEFYRRSRKLINFEILDAMQLSLVQLFLLTGVYLQSTEYAHRCWNVIGLAIRTAQGLGLHTESSSLRSNQLDRELRRRLWHMCMLLDRLLAMTFGRPTMISAGSWDTPAPAMIDDEYLRVDGEGTQPSRSHSRMCLFAYSTQLFEIMDEILSSFYIQDSTRKHKQKDKDSDGQWSINDLTNILIINTKLDRFENTLPQFLKVEDQQSASQTHATLQAKVLQSRFLFVRIMLLRPVLLASVANGRARGEPANTERCLDHSLAKEVCTLCIKTAQVLLETSYHNLDSSYRSPGWHVVYFAFAGAIILLAAQLSYVVPADVRNQSFDTSWSCCIKVLEYYRLQISPAAKAITILENLKEKVQAMNRSNPVTEAPQSVDGPSVITPTQIETNPENIDSGISGETGFGIEGLNMFTMDPLTDVWFTQQMSDMSWLDFT